MNLNANAHFSQVPSADITRSRFDRSCWHASDGYVGDVIPVYVDPDILPGDTVTMDTSKVIRFQTMLTPVMDNMYADFYWFFVPHRIIWDHWINFMGENTASAWIPSATYTVPQIAVPPTGSGSNNKRHTILDYLGYPVEMTQAGNVNVSALPLRAYCKVCEDWFRVESLSDPINIYTGDATQTMTTGSTYVDDVPQGGKPFKAAKFPDMWTTMLPSPQKGNAVPLPLGTKAPVRTYDSAVSLTNWIKTPMVVQNKGTGSNVSFLYPSQTGFASPDSVNVYTGYTNVANAVSAGRLANDYIFPVNLWADLSSATAANVNDIRFAFQLQKLLEKDAYGTRYKETIANHFSVDIGDARLQRSEYLGGNRVAINVNQVINSAQTSSDPLGDLGAYSLTADTHSDFTKSFVEHGTLLCCMVIRAEHSYCQGLAPFWKRQSRFDFYWPVFANIGEQPYAKDCLYLGATGTMGYQEAWADYRYPVHGNRVSGDLRPYLSGSLGSWTFADDYSSAPSLSDSWVREPVENVDRSLAVTSSTAPQFWFDIYFNTQYTRPMPVYSVPGLIDHH